VRQFTYIGSLPPGEWRFCLVCIGGQADVILVIDKTGANAPRMVIGDKLVELP